MNLTSVMLTWEYPPRIVGGLAAHVHDLSKALVKRGVDVWVFTTDFPGAPEQEIDDGVRVFRVDSYKHPTPDFASWISMMNVNLAKSAAIQLKELRDTPFLIHAHDWLVAHSAITLKHIFRAPLVATIHSTEYGRRSGIHDDYQRMIASTEAWLAREAWRVICCSRYMMDEIHRALGTPLDKMDVIPNGVYLERFTPPPSPEQFKSRFVFPGEKLVLYVGRLVYEKGVHLLVDAFPKVLSSVNARLVIVGEGYLKERISRRASELGIEHKVYLTGFLSSQELRWLYTVADVLVMPSLYEPFGIVALEASAAGAPIVSTCAGGIGEILTHMQSCVKVFPDPDSIAWGILRVLTDDALAEALRRNARENVEKNYSWSRISEQTLEVYQRVYHEYRGQEIWRPKR